MAFSHLHVHTDYSLFDGMSMVPELLDRAQQLKFPAIAITDHGTMMGAKELHTLAKLRAPDVKPIIGDEIYITAGYDHRLKDDEHRLTYHLILLAKNLTGYRNLCRIATIGATEGYYRYKARVSMDVLREYHEGLICLSACIGGEIPQYILDDDMEAAEEAIGRYREIFGEDFYLEVCMHPNSREGNPQEVYKMQRRTTDALLELGKRLGIKVVATNDSHFTYKKHAQAHDVMLAMNCKKTVSDPTRLRFTGEEYLKTQEEMLEVFKDCPEVVWNTQEVCDKVERYELDSCISMPEAPVRNPDETPDSALARLVKDGFNRLYDNNPEAMKRVNYELSVIRKFGYAGRFLIWYDIAKYARENHIMLGPGRGSSACSIVNRCLGVTRPDPLSEGLPFEKFIDPDSLSKYVTVDFDVEEAAVKGVWDYLCARYGAENVAGVVDFYRPKATELFPKVAAAMDICQAEIDEVMSGIEPTSSLLNTEALGTPSLKWAYEIAKTLSFRRFSKRTSPGGIVLGTGGISDRCPLCSGKSFFNDDEIVLSQYDCFNAEDIGLFRVNILYMKQLNLIKYTLNDIDAAIDLNDCRFDGQVAKLMHEGDSDGIFLFETEEMKDHLRSFASAPSERDLVNLNALYRPGLSDLIPAYQKNLHTEYARTGIREYDEIVEDTAGILMYMEQSILFLENFLGYSPGKATRMVRALCHYRENEIAQIRADFRTACKSRCIKEKTGDFLWWTLTKYSPYLMPKAHVLCCVRVSMACAYLKAHYRDAYMKNHAAYFR